MPESTTPLLVEDDTPPPVRGDEVEPGWERDREADDRYEAAERLAREERAERRAQQRRELDRWDDYQPPPLPDDRPPPERW